MKKILLAAFLLSLSSVLLASDEPKVFADRLRSVEGYEVEYSLPTKEGQDIVLFIVYPDKCSDCPPQNTLIEFPNKERPFIGERIYHWKATNGQEIAVTFNFSENGKRDSVKVEPPYNEGKDKEVFSIESKGGYLINIKVSWEGTKMSSFDMAPKIHPFAKW